MDQGWAAVGCGGEWLEITYMFISAAESFAGKIEMLSCLRCSNAVLHFNLSFLWISCVMIHKLLQLSENGLGWKGL